MGKKGRKTRWRTLTITDEHSDSEESSTTTSGHRMPKAYPQKAYYNRYTGTYSSQSTPTRKYHQCDGTKSTRSSSTASENKITFNEDEYTRITTPRQDVLFKKGYLNKPKTYQTQTSTGNSTTSTGNSTGNGTPDHQSTDLEYESQFIFPNGFVDQNGIYYVNSFEPYPIMIYNPTAYYPEYDADARSKRCSTGSLTESMSPNTTEETSHDFSQSETPSNVSDGNQISNVVCDDGASLPPPDAAATTTEPESKPRRLKKRARRRPSRQEGTSSESSVEERSSDDEEEKTTEEVEDKPTKYDLKPDAEEFVPRAYRQPETIPMEANVQFIKIPSNFVPMPILNAMGEFNAFIPPGIPINFIPQNYVNFLPYHKSPDVESDEEDEKASDAPQENVKEKVDNKPTNQIDIAKIVSKLEEAAKERPSSVVARNLRKKRFQHVDLKPPQPVTGVEAKKGAWKQSNSPKKEAQVIARRNYSDTLKKSMTPPNSGRLERSKTATADQEVVKQRNGRNESKLADEWIAVSSRKKRKNRSVEENEEVANVDESKEVDSCLIEVEAPSRRVEVTEADDWKQTLEVNDASQGIKQDENSDSRIVAETDDSKEEKKERVVKRKNRKDNVKTQQQPIKRVIIKDVDLSMEHEAETNVKVVEEVEVIPVETAPEPVIQGKRETPEKRTKKKKKKVVKSSNECGTVAADDSYHFLLDESLDKTNVEVSHELDKMIQRGMYNNLEEKIKSMNIESNDDFFKSIIDNISTSRESSVEKNSFIKNPDLSKILNNSNFMKASRVEHHREPDDFLAESAVKPVGGDTTEMQDGADSYPITKAVKEWMVKRRETTPDVELLKSPSTLIREFGEDEQGAERRASSSSSVEEGEDALEVDEGRKAIGPKHGNLPYRAICCSIM